MEIDLAEDEQLIEIGKLIRKWRPSHSQNYLMGLGRGDDYVALIEGSVVAWLNGHHEQREIWKRFVNYRDRPENWTCSYISMMFVHPEFRCNGLGSALLSHFARDAEAVGNSLIVVLSDRSSSESKEKLPRFYARNGYVFLDDGTRQLSFLGCELPVTRENTLSE